MNEYLEIFVLYQHWGRWYRSHIDWALKYRGSIYQGQEMQSILAFDKHMDEHGCGTGDTYSPTYIGGFLNCDEAMRLFRALPPSEQVLIA